MLYKLTWKGISVLQVTARAPSIHVLINAPTTCASISICRTFVHFSPSLASMPGQYVVPKLLLSDIIKKAAVTVSYAEKALFSTSSWSFGEKKLKDGKKEKGGGKGAKSEAKHVLLSDAEMSEIVDIERLRQQMQATLEHLRLEFSEKLALRTSAAAFDRLQVDTPDGRFMLMQLGRVMQKGPHLVAIDLSAASQHIGAVKNAILTSGANVNPQQDGTMLFLPLPQVTREHRESLAKNAKLLCENAKERLRHVHSASTKDLKKAKQSGHHSDDLLHGAQETLLAMTRQFSQQADEMLQAKRHELIGE